MILYIIVAILLTVFAIYAKLFNQRSQTCLFFILGFILVLIIGIRDYTINRDFPVYQQLFEEAPKLSVLKESYQKYNDAIQTEFSYSLLCTLLKETSNSEKTNFIIIFLLYALLGVSVKMLAIKKLSHLPFIALFIYFCNVYPLQEMTQVRAGVALGFVLLGVYELQKERYWHFLLCILMGTFFHTSAIMGIVIYFFKKIKADPRVWGSIFIACIIVNISHFDILKIIDIIPFEFYQYKLKAYILLQDRENFQINYLNVGFILQNIIIIICYYYKEDMEHKSKNINMLLNMCCLSSCCYIFFGQIPGFAVRISEVFNCALIILIPMIFDAMKPKLLAEIVILIIGWGLFLINIIHSELLVPYKTLWS